MGLFGPSVSALREDEQAKTPAEAAWPGEADFHLLPTAAGRATVPGMIRDVDEAKFQEIQKEARSFYEKIGSIDCPALKRRVHFDWNGLRHLRFSKGKERDRATQMRRLELLPLAVKLIQNADTYDSFEQYITGEPADAQSGMRPKARPLNLWTLVGFVEGWLIKVVILKSGHEGAAQFWSVYPCDWAPRREDSGPAQEPPEYPQAKKGRS